MALELWEKIKLLDEYTDILKQDLLFLMAECKLKPENTMTHKIIRIKQELDRIVEEKMRLSQICHGNINNRIALTTAASAWCF
jgi:D-hexose-6-phosphate mutarotase